MIRAALALAQRGLQIFPCSPRCKVPATANGLKDATTDPAVIRQWWHEEPDYNIAAACGAASGFFVTDVDGLDAEMELRRLEAEHGALPATVEAITARGRHAFFKWCPDVPVRNSVGKIAPGIDVRAEGGYVLVPPSIHPTGKRYAWSVDSAGAFATAPDWLLAKANGNGKLNGGTSVTEWRQLVHDGAAEGTRDCTVTKLAGYLLRRHIDPIVARDLLQCWNEAHCNPPLPETDIDRVVNSICGMEVKRRLGRG